MTKNEFIAIVARTIEENPEWFAPTVIAAQQGMLNKLDTLKTRSADAQAALVALIDPVNRPKSADREWLAEKLHSALDGGCYDKTDWFRVFQQRYPLKTK